MLRYLRLLRLQARMSVLLAFQYRLDFALSALMALFWPAVALAPLVILFRMRDGVAGWSAGEALVVVGFFTLVKGVLSGALHPSLAGVVEHVRRGTLDFLLLKPVDAQFMVSTSRFDLARLADVTAGVIIMGVGLARADHAPSVRGVALAALLLLAGLTVLYSAWILVVSLAFKVVKVDNLTHLISAVYDAARWPSSVFRGFLAILFTFIIPLALMTTFPALALLDRVSAAQVAASLAAATAFFVAARVAWQRSIAHYTSAGG